MSLRVQFLLSVVVALLLSLALEGAVASWQAHRSVENEMHRALDAGDHIVDNALLSLPRSGTEAYLDRLVKSFDGNRHVRVSLVEQGRERIASQVEPPDPVPGWFVAMLQISTERRIDTAPALSGVTLLVSSDPRNEISEVWAQFRDGAFSLGLFCLLVLGLLHLALARIHAPLANLRRGFAGLGSGDYTARVEAEGPRETSELAKAFNRMAGRLEMMEQANARMGQQMLAIQEEERTELARELHDEMGPFLFAMRVDAEGIEAAARKAGEAGIAARARAVGEAVTHIQRHVRQILKELRPADFAEFGLAVAIENLAQFWRRHVENITIVLDIEAPQDGFGADADAAIYRLIQEGLTNAARHGGATTIWVTIKAEASQVQVAVEDDGVGFAPSAGESGMGLRGMRERLAALGGTLTLATRSGGGTRLSTRLARAGARETEPAA